METKQIRVAVTDHQWLCDFILELQDRRYEKVSLAEAVSTLIAEHQVSHNNSYDVPERMLKRLWSKAEKAASRKRLSVYVVYGGMVAEWLRERHRKGDE